MRLILEIHQSDGCTFSFKSTYPVEYESAEALRMHLMAEALTALQKHRSMKKVVGLELSSDMFYELVSDYPASYSSSEDSCVKVGKLLYVPVPPSVLTVDEWFSSK